MSFPVPSPWAHDPSGPRFPVAMRNPITYHKPEQGVCMQINVGKFAIRSYITTHVVFPGQFVIYKNTQWFSFLDLADIFSFNLDLDLDLPIDQNHGNWVGARNHIL